MLERLAEQGVGIVMITHHVSDMIPAMLRVVFMVDGWSVADGAQEELMTSALLSSLFRHSIEVTHRNQMWAAR